MTDAMIAKLTEMHADEITDHKKYIDLAKDVDNRNTAGILRDIAHDEETHAKALSHILEKYDKI